MIEELCGNLNPSIELMDEYFRRHDFTISDEALFLCKARMLSEEISRKREIWREIILE